MRFYFYIRGLLLAAQKRLTIIYIEGCDYIKNKIHISDLNNLILPYVKEGKLTNTEIARKLNIRKENGSYDLEPIKIIKNRPKILISNNIKKLKTYSLIQYSYNEYNSSISIRCVIKEDGTFKNKGEIIKKNLSNIKQYYISVKTKKFRQEQKQRMLDKGYSIEQLPKQLQKI